MPPQTEVERTISSIWRELLDVEKVGRDDSFFDLGGHSLLMVRAHNKVREVFNRDISLVDMFRYPTVSALAKHLSRSQNGSQSATPTLQHVHDRAALQREALSKRRQQARKGVSSRG
jgi:acyl carrier protein